MRIDRWAAAPTIALWFRSVEGIPVPAGGDVPADLVVEPSPARTERGVDLDEAAEGWLHWWERALDGAFIDPADIERWPTLHRVVAGRWREATSWLSNRKRAASTGDVVKHLERELGRAPVFALDLPVLPVDEDELRRIGEDRWIVPERVYLDPAWPDRLSELVRPYRT
jgi:hypothetical protein